MQTGGVTSLMYACQQCREPEVLDILRKQPCAVRDRDRTLKSPLHYCAENPNISCAEALLKASPDLVNAQDENGYCPLHLAVIAGNKPLIKLLIAKGADVNIHDNEGHSAVHWAIVSSEKEALEMIILAGANPSTPDIHGGYPLHYAVQMCGANSEHVTCFEDAIRVVETLLYFEVDVNVRDKDGRQPILWAASAGSADAVVHLVSGGACVEAADKDELTALHCAASRGHTTTLETLISLCGANVDVIDGNGCSALFYSVTLGHADATELLLRLGAEPNRQDRKGRTPAHCGAAKGQLETLRILQKHGGSLWIRNVRGDIPLHEAVASGRKDLVFWLLSQNSEAVNIANNDGRCPLHIAAMYNNTEMVKILLDSKSLVNPVMRTSKGVLMTPLNVALCKGHRSCGKYLQLHGGVPFSKVSKAEPSSALRVSPPGDDSIVVNAEISKEMSSHSAISRSPADDQGNREIIKTESTDKRKVYRRRKKKKSPSANIQDSDSDNSLPDVKLKTLEKRKLDETDDKPKVKRVQLPKKSPKTSKSSQQEEIVVKASKTKPLLKAKSFSETKNVSDLSPEDFPPLMQTVDHLDAVIMEPEEGKVEPSVGEVEIKFRRVETSEEARKEVVEEKIVKREVKKDAEEKTFEKLEREETCSKIGDKEKTKKPQTDKTEKDVEAEAKVINEEIKTTKIQKDVEEVAEKETKELETQIVEEEAAKKEELRSLKADKTEKDVEEESPESPGKDEIKKHEAVKVEKDVESQAGSEGPATVERIDKKVDAKTVSLSVKAEKAGNKNAKTSKGTGSKPTTPEETKSKLSTQKKTENGTPRTEGKIESETLKAEETRSKPIAPKKTEDGTGNKKPLPAEKNKNEKLSETEDTENKPENLQENSQDRNGKLINKEQTGSKPTSPKDTVDEKLVQGEETGSGKPQTPKNTGNEKNTKANETESKISPQGELTLGTATKSEGTEIPDPTRLEERSKPAIGGETGNGKATAEDETEVEKLTEERIGSVERLRGERISNRPSTPKKTENEIITAGRTESGKATRGEETGSKSTLIEGTEKPFEEPTLPNQVHKLEKTEDVKTSPKSPTDGKSKKIIISQPQRTKQDEKSEALETNSQTLEGIDIPAKTKPEPPSTDSENNPETETVMTDGKTDPVPREKKTNNFERRKTPRVSRLCRRHRDLKNENNQISVTQLVQNTIRKYHMEKGIFYQLLELKRYQIRSGKANEQVLVKRLADEYERSRTFVGMKPFSGLYRFREFEKFLYDQLKALNTRRSFLVPEVKSYDDIDALSSFLKKSRYKIISEIPQPELSCTCITQRCHHSARAYTNAPCSAYIADLRHHKHQKPKRESFLPRIEPPTSFGKPETVDRPATLELIQGSEKHVITLPQSSSSRGKRYYVTFTIKGVPGTKDDEYVDESKDYFKHRHAKSV